MLVRCWVAWLGPVEGRVDSGRAGVLYMPPTRPAKELASGCEAAACRGWCRRGRSDPRREGRPTGGDGGCEGLHWGCEACFLGSLPGVACGSGGLSWCHAWRGLCGCELGGRTPELGGMQEHAPQALE
ncbi:hypothetical protein NDU88_002124 [Pleurodeles waltl]|uniref:Uncharacterized protein n=1 Tax=Pleurodeles waltl TaxID=8319 RepID=A0AAV7KTA3_PLEWA|nr:hypothetical protein NDU88_002124 [Pleurodeles waltl]